MKKYLIKHVGNMGDMIFFIPPVLATLKRRYPDCHITFVTAWGFKENSKSIVWPKKSRGLPRVARRAEWGKKNQDGFCIALLMTHPHIDQLVHWHDTKLSLDGNICVEEGRRFPTWSRAYFEQQKNSGEYDAVFELDFGLAADDNPVRRMYEAIGLPDEDSTEYRIYFTDQDIEVARTVMRDAPRPRIVLLEGLESTTTRGWDPKKIPMLEKSIQRAFGTVPLWFGSNHIPTYHGRPLTLRENIATLTLCDAAVGVLSGPLHLAAAAGCPTLTLYCDHPFHRAAPAYFLNPYISKDSQRHRTLLGPTGPTYELLKPTIPQFLTPAERAQQHFRDWSRPGRQATKSCLAVVTVDEIMRVLHDMILRTTP